MNSEPTLLNVKERQSVRYCIPAPLKFEQIKINLRKNCGRIEAVTELRKEPIACVSFGPSLKDTWEKIKEFKYVMSCSGSHKFLVEHGIIPTFHCLPGHAVVHTEDGDRKLSWIVRNRYSGKVLSYSESDGFVWRKVLAHKKSDRIGRRWLRLQMDGKRHNLQCSTDHRVAVIDNPMVPEISYREAKDAVGLFSVGVPRPGMENALFGKTQTSVLLGTLLGDATIHKDGTVLIGHCEAQSDYLELKQRILGGGIHRTIYKTFGGEHPFGVLRVPINCQTKWLREALYNSGKKSPIPVLPYLDEASLAFWYMDDGNLMREKHRAPRARLFTIGFSENDQRAVVDWLLERWAIQASLVREKYTNGDPKTYIRFNVDGAVRLFELIAKYVPESMEYKLSAPFRGGEKHTWKSIQRLPFSASKVLSLGFVTEDSGWSKSDFYDIQIEDTGNFVTRGTVVHNCDVDPREHKIKLIGEPQKGCEYLIASTCHPKLIDYLQNAGCTVKLWHIFDSEEEGYRILPPGEWMVTGGCSVGTRTMTLARFIGFTEQHIFGMDGSFPSDGNSHAGEHPNDASRKPPYETEYNGVKYRTTPAMLEAARNAWHELDMLKDVCLDRRCAIITEGGIKSIKQVVDSRYSGKVASIDSHGNFMWSKVISHSSIPNMGRKRWVSVETCGRKRKLICTEDHLCAVITDPFSPKIEFRPAAQTPSTLAVRYPSGIHNHVEHPLYGAQQAAVLIGTMLGDGTIGKAGRASITHGSCQMDYLQYKASILGGQVMVFQGNGYTDNLACRLSIPNNGQTAWLRRLLYPAGIKTPGLVLKYADEIALAFWYMDDGSLVRPRRGRPYCTLHTEGFSNSDQFVIVNWFRKTFNIRASVAISKGRQFIRLLTNDSEAMCEMIAPYVPPCMEYKLHPHLRNNKKASIDCRRLGYAASIIKRVRWLDPKDGNYQSRLYDIEVEGAHNFVASGSVVHNCPTFYGEGLVQTMAKDWKRKELPEKAQVFIAFDKPELISAGYCEQNRKLHQENPLYGIGGARHAKTVMQLCKAMESTSVLDYGCQPPDARVLTPTGWRKIGDIQKGDLVIGSDGCPTKVLGVHRPGIAQIYRVSFNDGASLLVDGGHLWAVRTSNHQKRGQPFTLRQTRDLASEKLRWNNPNHPDSKPLKWRIPMVKPVQFEGQKLPFHPYIMGVLLGDGCLCMSLPTFVTATPGLAEEVAALLPPTVALSPYRERKNGLKVFGIAKKSRRFGRGEQRKNPISDALLALGLSGARAWTKFIPNIYLFAKESERFALLQGLLDTDGEVRQKHTSYCTTSEELAHNVVFLSQSLGFNARIATKVPTYQGGKKGRLAYIVHIKPSDGAKVARVKSAGRRVEYHANRLIENIDAAGQSEVVGIEVEAEDGLYVTEHCIVTHNCGKGQLARELPFAIWEYDPAIPDKQASPRPADLCVATDVLEHIEPEKLHFVLEDLRRCTLRVGYFVIHTGPSSKVLPDGRNTHLIQRGRIWWKKKLKKYFALAKDSIIEKPPLLYCVVAKKTK